MSTLASPASLTSKRQPYIVAACVVAALALLAWGLSRISLDAPHKPRQQTVKITLPDTPPPPPPKQDDKRPEPKEDNKPAPQMEQKQVEAPPQAAAALKMEGAAGDGPSAFSAGSVGKEYSGGNVVSGGTPGGTGSDRAKYQFYVNSAKQLLKDEIERHLQSDQKQVVVTFSLWVKPDGSVDRYELSPTGNARADDELQTAFSQMAKGARLPPPRDTPQPLRMRMTLLPIAS
jgi:protein TonB